MFLSFANFYWQFIQGFSRIVILLTSILKTIRLPDKPIPSRNNGSKLAFNKNNNNRPASRKNNGNNEIDGFSVSRNSMEYAKKSEKLSKLGKLSKSG